MNLTYKVSINRANISSQKIEFPNGKQIIIAKNSPYISSDETEYNFLCKQPFLAVSKLKDKEYKHLFCDPNNQPFAWKKLTLAIAKRYGVDLPEELNIKKMLEKLGHSYDGYVKKESAMDILRKSVESSIPAIDSIDNTPKDLSLDDLKLMLKDLGYRATRIPINQLNK